MQSYLDGGGSSSSKQTDYTNELAECLKEWVSVEIDQTLWEAAKEAHAEAVTQMGNLVGKINSTIGGDPNDSSNNPNVVLEEVDVYYGRIFDAKSKTSRVQTFQERIVPNRNLQHIEF